MVFNNDLLAVGFACGDHALLNVRDAKFTGILIKVLSGSTATTKGHARQHGE